MKIKLSVMLLIICIVMSICIGCSVSPVIPTDFNSTTTKTSITKTSTENKVVEVKLSEEIKEAGIADSKDRLDWGINLNTISANYKVGAKFSGWIILHNGDNEDRLVYVSFLPSTQPITESSTGKVYAPTPSVVKQEYVTIGEKIIRLTRMETRAIEVSLLVPESQKIGVENWAFYINADSVPIIETEQTVPVITENNDNGILELQLQSRLLQGSLKSIKGITSSIGENLVATKYDIRNSILTIEGLRKEALTRNVTVMYEGLGMFTFACNQIWLMSML